MTHPHGEKLSAYIDGMLDVAQTHQVADHLATCVPCRQSVQDLQQTKAFLGRVGEPEQPAPEFWAAAYRQVRLDAHVSPRSLWRFSAGDSWRSPQRRMSGTLAVVAVVAGMILLPVISHSPQSSFHVHPAAASISPDSVDVSFLVQAHAESAAHQPLADTDRQDMIAMDDSLSPASTPLSADPPDGAGSDAPQ